MTTSSCEKFNVTVANREKIPCNKVVESGQWLMGGRKFSADLNVIPLGGYDIILGVKWMKTVSPVTFDFFDQKISINWNKEKLTLSQESSSPRITIVPEVNQGFSLKSEEVYLLVQLTNIEGDEKEGEISSEKLKKLVDSY